MYGTVARIQVIPGKEAELIEITEAWSKARGEQTGQVAEFVFKSEGRDHEYVMVAVFSDRDTYVKNARDPETDRWYRRMREVLAADPEWNDGEVVSSAMIRGI